MKQQPGTSSTDALWLGVLYSALAEPTGLLLRVSDFDQARAKFYRVRAKAGDSALDELEFRRGLEPGTLMLVHVEHSSADPNAAALFEALKEDRL